MLGSDDHLPALAPQDLTREAIAHRLGASSGRPPELTGDGGRWAHSEPLKPAAVLIALVERPPGLSVLLTRRTAHLRAHAGQISFPGGRLEPHDASAAHGALREAQEEVGLDPDAAQVLGEMAPYLTVTGFEVVPVVASVRPPLGLRPDPHEVDEVFEVPLTFLMNPVHHRRHRLVTPERDRHFLSMPWTGPGLSGVEQEFFIWGATAAMLRNLYHLLAPEPGHPNRPDMIAP